MTTDLPRSTSEKPNDGARYSPRLVRRQRITILASQVEMECYILAARHSNMSRPKWIRAALNAAVKKLVPKLEQQASPSSKATQSDAQER
jgi:hypothetical protein